MQSGLPGVQLKLPGLRAYLALMPPKVLQMNADLQRMQRMQRLQWIQ